MGEKKKGKVKGGERSPKSTGEAARKRSAAKPAEAGKRASGTDKKEIPGAQKKVYAARKNAYRALDEAEQRQGKQRPSRPEKRTDEAPKQEAGGKQMDTRPGSFPIAAVGASAGGLEALKEFFGAMPTDTGVGFVVVTHQHPGHVSLLPEIISRNTKLPVVEVREPTRIEPDHIYLGSPGGLMSLEDGVLYVEKMADEQAPHLPIDHFFRSLAADQREKAICVILSGTGSDGTVGLKSVKGEFGMVMVQTPQSAKYASMPASAHSTGLADYILAPNDMPEHLLAYVQGPYLQKAHFGFQTGEERISLPREPVLQILNLLKRKTGHDFSHYKPGTIQRRIERRMTLHQTRKPTLYVEYLRDNPREVDLLLSELLISVTSFFRDSKAFEALAEGPLPELIRVHPEEQLLRVWVVGCATGEEAYSVAIVLQECLERLERPLEVQIFATDLDDQAIRSARQGRYPAGIEADVSRERLNKFFHQEENFYQVRKVIRDMIVFAPQNVTKDPPFTKLNMIVCRNLLIYLDLPLQRKVLELFHYSLRHDGLLFLGPSETLGKSAELFKTVDSKWKIFRRKETKSHIHPAMTFPEERPGAQEDVLRGAGGKEPGKSITSQDIERLLLSRFAPTSLIVDEQGTILYIHGRTGEYLEPAAGEYPRSNVLDMARKGLLTPLAAGIRQASSQNREVVRRNIQVKTNSKYSAVDVTVSPIGEPHTIRGLLLVSLTPSASPTGMPQKEGTGRKRREVSDTDNLEQELRFTKESLQTTIEELETSNEELKSSNEELQSTNEELASTNEELETSKEELQSLNEELTTVNAELESKVTELARLNDDMQNLLNSTSVATIFLNQNLEVKRYTEQAKDLFNLILGDVGRPLQDLASNFEYAGILEDCKAVLRDLSTREAEVVTHEGKWYMMRIMPYRTADNVIDGVVLTFVQIDRLKRIEGYARATGDHFEDVIQTAREPILLLDEDLRVLAANESFHRTFGTRPRQARLQPVYELGNGCLDVPELKRLLEETLPREGACHDVRTDHDLPGKGRKAFLINARRVFASGDEKGLSVLAWEEVIEEEGS